MSFAIAKDMSFFVKDVMQVLNDYNCVQNFNISDSSYQIKNSLDKSNCLDL